MGEDLTFENYLPKLGDARVFDPKWQKKYGYREWTYTHVPDLTATYDEKKARRDFDEKAQEKRAKYADGLHGYDYYSSAGSDVTEFQALKKRFEQSNKTLIISLCSRVCLLSRHNKSTYPKIDALNFESKI